MNMTLTTVVVIAAAFFVLKFAQKIMSKLIGVIVLGAVVLGYMYKQSIGPFKENVASLAYLQEKYCGADGDKEICDCILSPALADMQSRFSDAEMDSLKVQKIKAAYVLQKSLSATKEKALMCLSTKGSTEKYKVFLQDFVPIENKYLDELGEKAREVTGKLKDELTGFQESKETIDSKY